MSWCQIEISGSERLPHACSCAADSWNRLEFQFGCVLIGSYVKPMVPLCQTMPLFYVPSIHLFRLLMPHHCPHVPFYTPFNTPMSPTNPPIPSYAVMALWCFLSMPLSPCMSPAIFLYPTYPSYANPMPHIYFCSPYTHPMTPFTLRLPPMVSPMPATSYVPICPLNTPLIPDCIPFSTPITPSMSPYCPMPLYTLFYNLLLLLYSLLCILCSLILPYVNPTPYSPPIPTMLPSWLFPIPFISIHAPFYASIPPYVPCFFLWSHAPPVPLL